MQTHYELLGGGDTIRKLVDRFYDLMDDDPDYYGIRKLHPADLTESRNKLFWFLSGWTGGPPEYTDRFGHPFLRRRHMPFVRDRRSAGRSPLQDRHTLFTSFFLSP